MSLSSSNTSKKIQEESSEEEFDKTSSTNSGRLTYDYLNFENDIKLLNPEEIDKKLCECTANILYLITGKILIEFLTLNLYVYIKSIKRRLLLKKIRRQILNGTSFQDIKDEFEMIDNTIMNYALSAQFLNKLVIDTQHLFGNECEKLIKNCLQISKERFYKIFCEPDLIKFRLRIGSDYVQKNSDNQSLSINRSSLNSLKSTLETKSRFRFFGNFIFFRIFFPGLVYQSDLKKTYSIAFLNKLKTEGTLLNKTLKSFVGLIASFLITYLFYLYLKYIVETEAYKATIFVILLFLVLSIGLVFDNPKFRCIILLIIPFMASSRGRTIILMNCYTLTSIYVIPNVLTNFDILIESFNCNKKLVKEKTEYLAKNHDVYHDFKEKIAEMKELQHSVETSMQTMNKVIRKNLAHVNTSYQRLKDIELLNIRAFANFSDRFEPFINNFKNECHSYDFEKYWYKWLIPISIPTRIGFHLACLLIGLIKSPTFESHKEKVKQVKSYYTGLFKEFKENNINKIREQAEKRIDSFTNEFQFEIIEEENNATKIKKENFVKKGLSIVQIYQERIEKLNKLFVKVSFLFPISFVLLIFSAISYHKKYLKRDNFQNYIISVKFYEIDFKRRLKNLPTLLPLNDLLKIRYTELFDLNLTKKERHFTIRSLITLSLFLLPNFLLLFTEHILILINVYLATNTHVNIHYVESQNMDFKMDKNEGFLANFYNAIFRLFKDSENPEFYFDNKRCLPSAVPQNKENEMIIKSIILVYFLTVFQAYIKRLRSVLCGCVYPERDKERAVWLYNNLFSLYSRMGLIERVNEKESRLKKMIKKLLWQMLNLVYTISMFISFYYFFGMIERVGLKSLIQKYKLKILPIYFKYFPPKFDFCMICITDSKDIDCVKCDNEKCPGFYCIDCFIGLENVCKFCKRMISSDAQIDDEFMEQDSSDDEFEDTKDNKFDEESYFQSKKENLKVTEKFEKIEIYNFEKDRAVEIIDNCLKKFYFDIKDLMKNEFFLDVIKNSPNVKELFDNDYDMFDDLALFVIKNNIVNIKIQDCFSKKEISDKNFLESINEV